MPVETRDAIDRERLAGLRADAERYSDRLPGLLVEAERVAATVSQGVHGRRRTGVGETFWQYRPYQPGEPASDIDWRQSARSRNLFVRQQEWEAAQSVWFWIDQSPSMRFRSIGSPAFKRDRALLLGLALASLLVRGGEKVALLGSGRRPSSGRFALVSLAEDLLAAAEPAHALPPMAELPPFARLVLISDWLEEPEAVEQSLTRLSAHGLEAVVVQIVDPAEEELPFAGRALFQGLEGEGDALIGNVAEIRERYMRLFAAHRDHLIDVARRRGWSHVLHRSDHSPESGLMPIFSLLAPKGRG